MREIEDDRALLVLPFTRVLRRGKSPCFCEVKVTGDADETLVASGLVTYKLG